MATEIELKLSIINAHNSDVLEQLKQCLNALDQKHYFEKHHLSNVYFDTCELQLNTHKIALRIRKKGAQYIQTLKTKGQSVNGLSTRGEWEWDLPNKALNLAYLENCDAWPKSIAVSELHEVFETNFTRHQLEINWQNAQIELAYDQGDILAYGKRESINELELELKSGDGEALHLLCGYLQNFLDLSPSDISKAERGYRLGK